VSSEEIIVVGAGAIGASSAWRLAQDGHAVTLIDDPGAAPASDVAAGMLAPVTEAEFGEEKLLTLNLRSMEMYDAFVEELCEVTGLDVGYRRCGTLMVARDGDDMRALGEVLGYQQRLGLQVARWSPREMRAAEPVLSPRIRGGISVTGDHQIDPSALLAALLAACDSAGVERLRDRAMDVEQNETGVKIRTESGRILSCDQVVFAAGSYTGRIGGIDGSVPVRPVKGQLLQLRGRPGMPLPSANIRGIDVYMVTRADGRVVVGATVEEQGFDTTLTAGAVHDLLRDAYELWPGVVELEFVMARAGLRPATPDNAPAIGRLGERVVVAAGHYRHGILLTPVTAAAVAEIVGGGAPEWAADFDPHRFENATRTAR
jgi:glycine oxidase